MILTPPKNAIRRGIEGGHFSSICAILRSSWAKSRPELQSCISPCIPYGLWVFSGVFREGMWTVHFYPFMAGIVLRSSYSTLYTTPVYAPVMQGTHSWRILGWISKWRVVHSGTPFYAWPDIDTWQRGSES